MSRSSSGRRTVVFSNDRSTPELSPLTSYFHSRATPSSYRGSRHVALRSLARSVRSEEKFDRERNWGQRGRTFVTVFESGGEEKERRRVHVSTRGVCRRSTLYAYIMLTLWARERENNKSYAQTRMKYVSTYVRRYSSYLLTHNIHIQDLIYILARCKVGGRRGRNRREFILRNWTLDSRDLSN